MIRIFLLILGSAIIFSSYSFGENDYSVLVNIEINPAPDTDENECEDIARIINSSLKRELRKFEDIVIFEDSADYELNIVGLFFNSLDAVILSTVIIENWDASKFIDEIRDKNCDTLADNSPLKILFKGEKYQGSFVHFWKTDGIDEGCISLVAWLDTEIIEYDRRFDQQKKSLEQFEKNLMDLNKDDNKK